MAKYKYTDKKRAYAKEYYKEHSRKRMDGAIKWRKENPEKQKENCKKWREKNPEKVFLTNQKRSWNSRIRMLKFVSKSNNPKCTMCGNKNPLLLQFHHKNGDGGDVFLTERIRKHMLGKIDIKDEIESLEVLCCNCHILSDWKIGKRYPDLINLDNEFNPTWRAHEEIRERLKHKGCWPEAIQNS